MHYVTSLGSVPGLGGGSISDDPAVVAAYHQHTARVLALLNSFEKAVRDRGTDPRPAFRAMMEALRAYAGTLGVSPGNAFHLANVWLYWGAYRSHDFPSFRDTIRWEIEQAPRRRPVHRGWLDLADYWVGLDQWLRSLPSVPRGAPMTYP